MSLYLCVAWSPIGERNRAYTPVSYTHLDVYKRQVYMFSERAKTEHKFLVYEETPMLPPVLGDVNRLRQVFVNIIDNALKYVNEGGTVNVDVYKRQDYCMREKLRPGEWVIGFGYDHNSFAEKRHPDKRILDRACPQNVAPLELSLIHI